MQKSGTNKIPGINPVHTLPYVCLMQNVRTPLDMVRSPSLPYAEVFDQPLSMFFFWVFPNYDKPYPDTYELTMYLMQR
jgi:hypothetical protein